MLIIYYLELNIYFVLSADESTELLIKKLKFVSGTIQIVHPLYSVDFIAAHSTRLAEKIDIKNDESKAFICFQKWYNVKYYNSQFKTVNLLYLKG